MAISDPIADLLTRIRNALAAEHRYVDVRWSKMKESMVSVLKEEGFVQDFRVNKNGSKGTIRVLLKYTSARKPIIQGLKRVSKPGLRKYVSREDIPRVLGGMGISILTTAKGVLSGTKARKEGIGGEVLCLVW